MSVLPPLTLRKEVLDIEDAQQVPTPRVDRNILANDTIAMVPLMWTGASEDQWMVAPSCDERLTTWCGLSLGRVLQVQVAA
jgi:hypothetical protein